MTSIPDTLVKRRKTHRILAGTPLIAALALGLFGAGEQRLALGVLVAGVAVLALLYPGLGLVAMAALAVTNVSDNLIMAFGAPSLAKAAGPGLVVILMARWLALRERPLIDGRAILLFGIYALVLVSSAAWASSWTVAMASSTDFLKDVVIVLLTLAFFNRAGALHIYLHAATAFLAVICGLGIWQYATGNFSNDYLGFARFLYDSNRLSGPINDPNYFAATLVFFVPVLLGYILFGTNWAVRVIGGVLLAVFIAAIMLTASRGALVALAAGLGIFLLILDRKTVVPAMAVGMVIALAMVYALSDSLIERFELIFSPLASGASEDPAIEGRLASWKVAIHLFLTHPLGGVGAGNYNLYFQDTALNLGLIFRGEGRSAHSLYLEILSETGIIGLTAFLGIATGALLGVIRSMRMLKAVNLDDMARLHATFGIGLAGYLVAMIFLHDSYPRFLYTLLAIGVALPTIARIEVAAVRRTPRSKDTFHQHEI